jgi:hypothetical protein
MTRSTGILIVLCICSAAFGQGDAQVRAKADALFNEEKFTEALPLYSQLISLQPSDPQLSYHYGTCLIFNGEDKSKAVGYLKYAVTKDGVPASAWYWLGRAYHLDYQFKNALESYQNYETKADKKLIAVRPVDAFQKQCSNGQKLLSSLKEIDVKKKVEAGDDDFFRFYDLSDIGGKIVVLPDELKSSLDKKKKERMLLYLPNAKGAIYFGSYGKDGRTGKDIYRTELLPTGNFADPVKVAGYINTDQDEDFPFPHPDGKTFYFSSKGHNSMGGYDVFRASYDRNTGAFGPPENLDFAINTPDDDLLYIVDPEHREACFASARSSKQGLLHVYRVSTSQVPLVITVLQGVYSNEFDPADKKARIVVEDAVSRERITEVRTDKEGSYILALPRSGRFRFLVECGPSGKTHVGIVDVPKNDVPQGYRQELALTRQADLEKLVIRNFFEQPLEGDLIALALEEIKRRARLDVEERPLQQEVVQEHFDIFTRAGFTGDHNQATVQQLADTDARELEVQAADLKAQAQKAYAITLEATEAAEKMAREAQSLADAAVLVSDENDRHDRMLEAAMMREDSKAAIEKARTAHRTAQDLEAEQLKRTQMAISARQLAQDIRSTIAQDQEDAAVQHLTTLKQRVDQKAKPELDPTPLLRSEQAMLEKEKQMKASLQRANSARNEEKDVADRIKQLERERSIAKNNRRIAEIDKQLAQEQETIGHLKKETEQKFTVVKEQERELHLLRSEYELKKHLSTADLSSDTTLVQGEISGLAQRIATATSKIESMPVDERFMARIAAMEEERQLKRYEWDTPITSSNSTDRVATRAIDRSAEGDAQRSSKVDTDKQRDVQKGQVKDADVASVPVSNDGSVEEDDRIAGASKATGIKTDPKVDDPVRDPKLGANTERQRSDTINNTNDTAAGENNIKPTAEEIRNSADPVVPAPATAEKIDAATQQFLLENEVAELMQLEQAEKDPKRRQEIQLRKAELVSELSALEAQRSAEADNSSEVDDPYWEPVDLERVPMVFNRDTKEEDLVNKLFSEYYAHEASLKKLQDADERANGLHGLELMLADSLRAEMARQLMVLDLDASQADRILPRVERLRQIRQGHMAQAERYLQERQDEIASFEGGAAESTDRPNAVDPPTASEINDDPDTRASEADPLTDRFIQIEPDLMKVYYSEIDHRSPYVKEGVDQKEADLAKMDVLTARIDSALRVLTTINSGKQYDRLRKQTDRLIDDRLIIRTELGQRTAFLTKEEWNTANDSLRTLQREVTGLQLAPTEPVLLLAQDLRSKAQKQQDEASRMRKQADRTQDILLRDSLYRKAYSLELQALRELDRSLTVHNYLIGGKHVRGEDLSYDKIAARVLGIESTVVATNAVAEERSPTDVKSQEGSKVKSDPVIEPEVKPSADPSTNAKLGAVREEALESIRKKELALPVTARTPISSFEQALTDATPVTDPSTIDPVSDTETMRKLIVTTTEEAAMLDRKAIEMASRSTALRDSALTLSPSGREKVEEMAVRTQQLSDSLNSASLLKAQEARTLEANEKLAITNNVVLHRIVKYYYLENEERIIVLEEQDLSRFLQLRSIARDQMLIAAKVDSAATINRKLAVELEADAKKAEVEATNGRTTAIEGAERSRIFLEKAGLLRARVDSLENVSSRLKIASNENESRATAHLSKLDPTRAAEITAFEERYRRAADGSKPIGTDLADASVQKPSTAPVEITENPRIEPTPTEQRTEGTAATELKETASDRPVSNDPGAMPKESVPFDPARAALEGWNTGNVNTSETFVMPKDLEEDIFALHPTDAKKAQPILMNAGAPEGLVFKVQVGAFRNAIPNETFSDMTPVMGEDAGNGLTRYTAGLFTTFDQAYKAKDLVRSRGYRDAFVVAYLDGKRITLNEAMRMGREEIAINSASAGSNTANSDRGAGSTTQTSGTTRQDQGQAVPPKDVPNTGGTDNKPLAQATPAGNNTDTTSTSITSVPQNVNTDRPSTESVAPQVTTSPAIPAISPEEEKRQVLTSYPATAEAIIAQFTPTSTAAGYYPVTGVAPARPVEMIMGLFFTVQVGVYTKPVELEKLYNITPLVSELTETQKIRYSTGVYLEMESARERRIQIVDMGVKDAFVTAYLNGKRIPVRDARILLEAFGPSILAKP